MPSMAQRPASDYDNIERRIRAAMWIGGINDFGELAGRINARNLGETTLRKLNATRKPQATRLHLRAIAEACGVPYEFFTTGLLPASTDPEAPDALSAHHEQTQNLANITFTNHRLILEGVNQNQRLLQQLLAAVTRLEDAKPQAPRGDLGRDLSDDQTSPQSRPDTGTQQERDARQGNAG